MNLATILIFFVFIIPILLGVFLLRRSRKVALALISIPFIFMLGVAGWWLYESNHRFVSSTDLSHEQINEINLHEPINRSFKENYGDYTEEDNVRYQQYLEFDNFSVGTDFGKNLIVYVQTEKPGLTTMNEIQVGDSVEKVIEQYGEKYYKSNEMGQGQTINYVDRDANIHLQFWLEDDKVQQIAIYAM